MTWTRTLLVGFAGMAAVAGGLVWTGRVEIPAGWLAKPSNETKSAVAAPTLAPPLAVTVVRAEHADLVEKVLVTGSLIAREEILVGPEVDGLRVIEVLADEGDRVTKGQVLARLVSDTLEAQLQQNTAALARADAAIAQARSAIASAEARLEEASNAYERAKPLSKSGFLSESGMDQRESQRRTSEAALASARDGLKVAEADKAQTEAMRQEIAWRRARTDVRAPADGLISRRNAKVGAYASGIGEAMFRIVANGEIELDGEVPETRLGQLEAGQPATIEAAGAQPVEARVRLVSPEVDRATRLGRVRLFAGDKPGLRVGAFARAEIETRRSRGLTIPASAILYTDGRAVVHVVTDGRIATRPVVLGLAQGALVEVREGLKPGEAVVARSGTFLRDGDAVRPIVVDGRRVSEAG